MGTSQPIRVRADSSWNTPEPELTLLINAHKEVVGYCVGNDVSSRAIEGENPLYLPQAKTYNGACALGPYLVLTPNGLPAGLNIEKEIIRYQHTIYQSQIEFSQMKRTATELIDWLFREMAFPDGVFLLTGTGLVPPDEFSLTSGDQVVIRIGELLLENEVA